MKCLPLIKFFWLCFFGLCSSQLWAADTDWGVIPVGQETTISFASYDITRNFTDQYSFTLQAGTDSSFAVAVTFDVCKNRCGKPRLSYGIYDATGQLVSDSGSAVLTSGTYYFQVKGTGMRSGNSVDYSSNISFLVSAVPEPADLHWLVLPAWLGLSSVVAKGCSHWREQIDAWLDGDCPECGLGGLQSGEAA